MNTITFHFMIGVVVQDSLDMVTTYFYGSLDSEVYMKIHYGLKMPKAYTPCGLYLSSLSEHVVSTFK